MGNFSERSHLLKPRIPPTAAAWQYGPEGHAARHDRRAHGRRGTTVFAVKAAVADLPPDPPALRQTCRRWALIRTRITGLRERRVVPAESAAVAFLVGLRAGASGVRRR